VSLRLSAQHVNFSKLCAFLLTIGILQLSFLPGHRSSRSKIGGVGVPGQRQRSRTAAVAQSFCLPAHPGNGFGINASPAPFFSPGPGQFIEKVTLALQQEQNFGQTLPEFGFVFSPAAAVDNIDAEHM